MLSRTDSASAEKVQQAVDLLRSHNDRALIVTTPWEQLDGEALLQEMERAVDLADTLLAEVEAHHHDHGEHCDCDHEHHHDHGEHCSCGHDHHADEVFMSWGMETPTAYAEEQVKEMLQALAQEETYGIVLRAKGMLPAVDGNWIYFDYVPGEWEVRQGSPVVTGKICVIGSALKQDALQKLFRA